MKEAVQQVAAEALRSGDAEAIADAQVGLAAAGLHDGALARRLATAASLLDPKRALEHTAGESAFAELLGALWKKRNLEAVAYGFAQLGFGATTAQLEALDAAMKKANGRRRTELVTIDDLVSALLRVRHGAPSARFPDDGGAWRRKTVTRSFCSLARQADGAVEVEVGTESIGSYQRTPTRLTSDLRLTLPAVSPPTPPPERESAADSPPPVGGDLTDTLPAPLRAELTALLRGPPHERRFERLLSRLTELEDPATLAIACTWCERTLALWPDAQRALPWMFGPERLRGPLRALPRRLCVMLDTLHLAASEWPAGEAPWTNVTSLQLLDFAVAPGSTFDPGVLRRFTALRELLLPLGTADEPGRERAARLSLPATLERLVISGTSNSRAAPPEPALRTLVERIQADARGLRVLELGAGDLAPLAALPEVELELGSVGWRGQVEQLGSQLPGRLFSRVEGSVSGRDGLDEWLRSGLSRRVRRLSLSGEPGQLAPLLRLGWPHLVELRFELPAANARLMNRKPPEYTFTADDLDALIHADFLPKLERLELVGVVGEERGQKLARALVQARPPLRRLALNASECGNETLALLADGGLLQGLVELELYRCKLKANGFGLLLGERAPQALTHLVLAKNAVNQATVERLAAWQGLSSLKRLDLREVTLTPAQRELLETSAWLRREALDFSDEDFW
ncbi:MAG: hypothetical protein ACOZQL_39505 [Myxococcota bacterium]